MIEGNRKVPIKMDGAEARALENAASCLDGEPLTPKEKRALSARLHRLAARYRLMNRVT